MAQYQVPQFIEVEDKIFGPLTLKQFIYLAGGGGVCLMFFTLLPMWLFFILALPVVAFSGLLAFYQVNGRPFVVALEHATSYFFGTKLYLWKPRRAADKPAVGGPTEASAQPQTQPVPTLSQSKLRDLSWSLNIKDRAQMGITSQEPTGFEV
jgi:hypothetical protein